MFKKAETMTFVSNEVDLTSVEIKPSGATVLGLARKAKLPLDSSCLEGTCGSCRVTVLEAPPELEPPHDVERDTLAERQMRADERLGCQMVACPGLKVKIPVYD